MIDAPSSPADLRDWPAEVARLNKIIQALMNRAERSTNVQGSDFSLFQTAVMLEEQVSARTAEVDRALQENQKTTRALRESEAKFRGLVEQSLVGIVMVEDGKFTYTNIKFVEMFGYSADELLELGPLDLAIESDRQAVSESFRLLLGGEVGQIDNVFRSRHRDGALIDVEVHGNAIRVGDKLAIIALILDVSKRLRLERELLALQENLREQSTHDALTGLYNRRYLEETLDRELILAQREGHPVSVVMGDLDHFKAVNDHFGHLAGDEVLRVFGSLMKRNARGSDIYCRYGGEEFLLVLPRMLGSGAFDRAEQLRIAMAAAPVTYGPASISVTASFGVATFPQDGLTGDELIAAADRALYTAKESGRNRVNVNTKAIRQATTIA